MKSIQFPVFLFIRCHSVNVDKMPKFAVFLRIDQRQCAHSTSFIWCFNAIFRYYQSHRRNKYTYNRFKPSQSTSNMKNTSNTTTTQMSRFVYSSKLEHLKFSNQKMTLVKNCHSIVFNSLEMPPQLFAGKSFYKGKQCMKFNEKFNCIRVLSSFCQSSW